MIICSGCEKKAKTFHSCDYCDYNDSDNNQWCKNCYTSIDNLDLCPKCYKGYKENFDIINVIDKYIQESWGELGIGKLLKNDHDVENKSVSYVLDDSVITSKDNIKVVVSAKMKLNGDISSLEYAIQNLSVAESIHITISLYDHIKSISELKNKLFKALKVKNSALKAARTTLAAKLESELKKFDTRITILDSVLLKWEKK